VADQLGHANPSITLGVYFGRQVVSTGVARVLDRRQYPVVASAVTLAFHHRSHSVSS
jgi:hypothetical protein